jgi:hypothetical protein
LITFRTVEESSHFCAYVGTCSLREWSWYLLCWCFDMIVCYKWHTFIQGI